MPHDDGSVVGTLRTRVHLTQGLHPLVLDIAHNNGRWVGGPIASRGQHDTKGPGFGMPSDPDTGRIWRQEEISVA